MQPLGCIFSISVSFWLRLCYYMINMKFEVTALSKIGQLIESKRLDKNLSIRALASISGISHSEVNKIEDGRRINPSALHLRAIAKALDIDQILIMTMAGYIDPVETRKPPSIPLSDLQELNCEELRSVQLFIDFIRSQHKQR